MMKRKVIYVQRTLPILINPKSGGYYKAGDIITEFNSIIEAIALNNPHAFSVMEMDIPNEDENAVEKNVESKVEEPKVEELRVEESKVEEPSIKEIKVDEAEEN